VDEQELPYSVRVWLNEGGMLQCACMNSQEQKQVLAGESSSLFRDRYRGADGQ